jgi:hypothetical protein
MSFFIVTERYLSYSINNYLMYKLKNQKSVLTLGKACSEQGNQLSQFAHIEILKGL